MTQQTNLGKQLRSTGSSTISLLILLLTVPGFAEAAESNDQYSTYSLEPLNDEQLEEHCRTQPGTFPGLKVNGIASCFPCENLCSSNDQTDQQRCADFASEGFCSRDSGTPLSTEWIVMIAVGSAALIIIAGLVTFFYCQKHRLHAERKSQVTNEAQAVVSNSIAPSSHVTSLTDLRNQEKVAASVMDNPDELVSLSGVSQGGHEMHFWFESFRFLRMFKKAMLKAQLVPPKQQFKSESECEEA